jgi:hypothetical protein
VGTEQDEAFTRNLSGIERYEEVRVLASESPERLAAELVDVGYASAEAGSSGFLVITTEGPKESRRSGAVLVEVAHRGLEPRRTRYVPSS